MWGKSVQAKERKAHRVSHSQTEPCLRDALADAFNAAVGSTPDKIRSPGAFCALCKCVCMHSNGRA